MAERGPATGYYVWRLALKWRASVDRTLAPLGLTHAQYALLASLHALTRGNVGPSQRELADFSGLEPMYISKLARSLEDAGVLTREAHPIDPRAFQLRISAQGRQTLSAAMRKVRVLETEQLEPIGGTDSPRAEALRHTLRILLRETPAEVEQSA
jgi:DNA-binding MarR family transcriptional regulator